MLIGVDFDNTIVRYDRLFHALALERGLIPADLPVNKTAVRDYLRSVGREDDWTELQGVAYGPEILRAEPFPGVLEFFRECKRRGIATCIISHKTRTPYRGEPHDLHAFSRLFLRTHGFLDEAGTGLSDANVFLELSKEAKLARIAAAGCTHFIDDLPEFLSEASFPTGVQRILFDPESLYPNDPYWRRVSAWNESNVWLPSPLVGEGPPVVSKVEPGVRGEPSPKGVASLLASADLPSTNFTVNPIAGGGNNRGYRVDMSDGRSAFLKWYFCHPDDPRDRLGTEFAFASFCRGHGIDEAPQPLACDAREGLGLYEFIAGRKLSSEDIDDAAIDAAIRFYRRLNEQREAADAAALPIASEACFSVSEHLQRIGDRVDRLVAPAQSPDADDAFRAFVLGRLMPTWHDVQRRIEQAALDAKTERRLSPSDFGFHNVLRMPDGRLRFIDLEYAGWDDPAKLVCDFFCQVQLPVPRRYWKSFVAAIATDLHRPEVFVRRSSALLAAYRVKWCCIVLNVFLPIGSTRRAFAAAQSASPERRTVQLQTAHDVLNQVPIDLNL